MTTAPTLNRHARRRLTKLGGTRSTSALEAIAGQLKAQSPVRESGNVAGQTKVDFLAAQLTALVDRSGMSLQQALSYLAAKEPPAPWRLYRSHQQLVLERGRLWRSDEAMLFEPIPGEPELPDQTCYAVALAAAGIRPYSYLEGWALVDVPVEGQAETQPVVTHHGFCFDTDAARVIETKFPLLAREYLGVMFPLEYVIESALKTGWHGVMPNDEANGNDLLIRGLPGTDRFSKGG